MDIRRVGVLVQIFETKGDTVLVRIVARDLGQLGTTLTVETEGRLVLYLLSSVRSRQSSLTLQLMDCNRYY